MRLALPGAALQRGILDWVRRTWRDTLNQPDPGDLAEMIARLVSIPFVDYARGDGITVGPGQQIEWSPILVSDADGWVDAYRGLWGLDTGDRMAGERAPAGPKYTRAGTVRQSWNDPLSFVGLAGIPTPAETRAALEDRVAALDARTARARSRGVGARLDAARARCRGPCAGRDLRARRVPGSPGGGAGRRRGAPGVAAGSGGGAPGRGDGGRCVSRPL